MTDELREAPGRRAPSPDALMDEQRRLINLAYRLLGSLADADDVAQEAYARWYAMTAQEQAAIESPGAWLTRVTGRICLDLLRSARARRERYVGDWIPEPLPGGTTWISTRSGADTDDPADRVSLDESISMAFMVLLESMSPAERVAFILHDVFRYPFTDVADVVGRTPAACRQLASSARRHIRSANAAGPPAHRAALVAGFKRAWEAGDIRGLVNILDPDATAVADGGGLVSAVLRAVEGADRIARTYVDIAARAPGLKIRERIVNGQPGLVTEQDGVTATVLAFDITGDRITHIWAIRNPDKLRPWITHRGSEAQR